MTEQHDYRLVLLAAIICAASSFTSFSIYSRVAPGHGLNKLGWLFLTGLSTGSGIWATHFVAMLSYSAGMPTSYDPLVTALSLLVAVACTTFGYFVCSRGTRLDAGVGGALIGFGIGLMHFTGMQALIVPGTLSWNIPLVAASLAVGAALASASMLAFHQRLRSIMAAAGLFTLAICGLHFTTMSAAVVELDPTISVDGLGADAPMLALAIAVITVLVLMAGLVAALIDRQTSQHSIDSIRELVDAASEGIVIADDGVIVNFNRRISELSGKPAEALIGLRVVGDLLDDHARRPPKNGLVTAETSHSRRPTETAF